MPIAQVHIVQLPFPSQADPHPAVRAYYSDYSRAFARTLAGYFLPETGLWELPLWVAHIAGLLEALGCEPTFVDLSGEHADPTRCGERLLAATQPGDLVLFSPLAQNFDLARWVSRRLIAAGRRTALGGNMAPLAKPTDASSVHLGAATLASLRACLSADDVGVRRPSSRGVPDMRPSYRLLAGYRGKAPLLRLHASHGCLYACEFCGDVWSRSLTVTTPAVLEYEVRQFEQLFPETSLIYIGDKTFGQSRQAVANLLQVFARRPSYRFIVQTHVLAVDEPLLDAMEQLGVVAVELGLETASAELLRQNRKSFRSLATFQRTVHRLANRGLRVILNILSGLPGETRSAHEATLDFIGSTGTEVWLYNLYNFVPYPMTPLFPKLRPRIVDWEFRNWREDGQPVFTPDHMTREESFGLFLEKVSAAHEAVRRNALGGAHSGAVSARGKRTMVSR